MILECPHCHSRYDLSGRATGTLVRCPCGASFPVPKVDSRAGQIRCPSCDGSCSPTDNSCSYCNARLAMAACPSCLGRVFAENKFCPHCGAKLNVAAKPAPDSQLTKKCPRCPGNIELHAQIVNEVLLHECSQCGGVWLDNHSFDRLLSARESSDLGPETSPTIANTIPPTSRSAPSRKYIPCPECSKLMNLQNFARCSGVIVDVCKAHGIWFDSGELGAVVRFVKSGGMEKARRKEIEQAQRELEIKMAHLPSSDQEQCSWIQECNSPSLFGRALQIMIKTFLS